MAQSKKYNARTVHKNDKEANWSLAENFIPLKGELIVYNADEENSFARLKMGDGETYVKDLPFLNPLSTGEALNSLLGGIGTSTISENGGALGINSSSGRRAFYIKSIDFDNHKIYLSTTQFTTPEVGSVDNTDTSFETPGYAKNEKFSIISDGHYPFCGTIVSVVNNVVTYSNLDSYFARRGIGKTGGEDDQTFSVPTKPHIGSVVLGMGAYGIGQDIKATGRGSFGVGRNNVIGGNYGFAGGRNNEVGSYGAVFGNGNKIISGSLGYGSNNADSLGSYQSLIGGQGNTVKESPYGMFAGYKNTVNAAGYSVISGSSNTINHLTHGLVNGYNKTSVATHPTEKTNVYNIINGETNYIEDASYVLAIGKGLKSTSDNQLLLGTYNTVEDNAAIIYGNGGSEGTRSKTFAIYKDGSAFFRRPIKVQGITDLEGNEYLRKESIGARNTITSGDNLPLGYDNTITGENNTVVGNDNNIAGRFVTALGKGLTATEDMYGTVIVGRGNVADKNASFIIGGNGINSMSIHKSTKKITFNGDTTFNDSVTAPTFKGALVGNADSASKDTEGNVISETYFKKSNIICTPAASGPIEGVTALEAGQFWFVY